MTSIVQLLLAIKNVKLVITKCEEREVIKSKATFFQTPPPLNLKKFPSKFFSTVQVAKL